MRLNTSPVFYTTKLFGRVKRDGKQSTYYKVVQYQRDSRKKKYVCYLSCEEFEKIRSGEVPAYIILRGKGVACVPAGKPAKQRTQSWSVQFIYEKFISEKDMCTVLERCIQIVVMKRNSHAYVYCKRVWNDFLHEPKLQDNEKKKMMYLGEASEKDVWHNLRGLTEFLVAHGYNVDRVRQKEKSRRGSRAGYSNFESVQEYVMNQREQGDVEPVQEQYESVGEFLEACPDDEESAREIYGDEAADEYYGETKETHDNEYRNEDDEPKEE